MKDDQLDEKLKELFQGIRLQDAERMPDFRCFTPALRLREYNQRHIPVLRYSMVFFAMVALCLSTLIYYLNANQSQAQNDEHDKWTSLSNWQATTDNLLTMSGTQTETTFLTTTDLWFEDSVISEIAD